MSKIPESVMIEVRLRSGDSCEILECRRKDWRGLQYAHIIHRGIGGRNGDAEKIINNSRNLAHLCCYHHDVLDRRVWDPALRAEMLETLKLKIGWYEWAEEARAKGINIGRIE